MRYWQLFVIGLLTYISSLGFAGELTTQLVFYNSNIFSNADGAAEHGFFSQNPLFAFPKIDEPQFLTSKTGDHYVIEPELMFPFPENYFFRKISPTGKVIKSIRVPYVFNYGKVKMALDPEDSFRNIYTICQSGGDRQRGVIVTKWSSGLNKIWETKIETNESSVSYRLIPDTKRNVLHIATRIYRHHLGDDSISLETIDKKLDLRNGNLISNERVHFQRFFRVDEAYIPYLPLTSLFLKNGRLSSMEQPPYFLLAGGNLIEQIDSIVVGAENVIFGVGFDGTHLHLVNNKRVIKHHHIIDDPRFNIEDIIDHIDYPSEGFPTRVTAVKIDSKGNLVIAGTTSHNIVGLSATARKDVFVLVFDRNSLDLIHKIQIGTSGRDYAVGLSLLSNGNLGLQMYTSDNVMVKGSYFSMYELTY